MAMNAPPAPATVNDTLDSIVKTLEEQPYWRERTVKALFPESDTLPKLGSVEWRYSISAAVDELDKRLTAGLAEVAINLKRLEERVEAGFAEATADRDEIKRTVRDLEGRVEAGFAEAAADREEIKRTVRDLEARVEAGFAEAAADREEIKRTVRDLEARVEAGFAEAAADRQAGFAEAAADREEIKRTMRDLKGQVFEHSYYHKADAIFGVYMRRGRKVTSKIGELLYEAVREERISPQERVNVLATDLLWGGVLYETGEEVVMVVEASWLAEATDIERASQRASILRRIGVKAIPVVAAREWPPETIDLARQHRVLIVTDGVIGYNSWLWASKSLD